MIVTIPVPDEFAARFASPAELGRRALEALALAEFRAGRLGAAGLQQVLGLADQNLHAFLTAHGIAAEVGQGPEGAVAFSRAIRASNSLGGLRVEDLIREGRR